MKCLQYMYNSGRDNWLEIFQRGACLFKKCSIYSLLKSLHTLLIDTESPQLILKYLDYVGSTRLCQILPSNDHTQDMSRNGDLLEPGGIKFQSEFNKIVFTLSFCFWKKLNWSSTDQLAPLEEDERYPFSRASHDHVLWQGFTFVSFNVNLQDHFFCLYACLVGKVPFCDFSL